MASTMLRVDMFDLAALGYAPAGNRVEMVGAPAPTIGDKLGARRLHISGIIRSAALKHRGSTVPSPRRAKSRDRHWQHRLLERGLRPARTSISGDFNLGNAPIAGPGETCDFMQARGSHRKTRRGPRDHRLGFLRKTELQRLSVVKKDRVLRGFILGHGWCC